VVFTHVWDSNERTYFFGSASAHRPFELIGNGENHAWKKEHLMIPASLHVTNTIQLQE
jgi:hypothetical protein